MRGWIVDGGWLIEDGTESWVDRLGMAEKMFLALPSLAEPCGEDWGRLKVEG
jgi:hypothetical protein